MKKFYISIFLILTFALPAQYYNDARLWAHLSIEKKINKQFAVQLTHKSRWDNNISRYELGYLNLGLAYEPVKWLKLGAGYNFALKRKNSGYFEDRQTYYGSVSLRKDFRRFKFIYRNLFQWRYYNAGDSKEGYIPYYFDRNKITIKYEATKRFGFYVAEEIRLALHPPQGINLNRSRSFIGTVINITKDQSLEFYFAYQLQLEKSNWYKQKNSYSNQPLNRDYIYGIGYNIQF